MTSGAAAQLGRRVFGAVLFGGARRPLELHPGERVVRYQNATTAVVEQGAGRSARTLTVHSTVPLVASHVQGTARERSQVATPAGTQAGSGQGAPGSAPVDLSLLPDGSAFVPENSSAPVSIAAEPSAGVSFPGQSFTVHVEDPGQATSDAAGELVGNSVWFGNFGPEQDVSVSPTDVGAEISWQLRGLDAPTGTDLAFDLPKGMQLRMDPAGSGAAQVVRGGQVVATVLPPSGTDAAGRPVPVAMSVDPQDSTGRSLRLTVSDLAGYQFPVAVDPAIVEEGQPSQNFNGWEFLSTDSSQLDCESSCSTTANSIGFYPYQTPPSGTPAGLYLGTQPGGVTSSQTGYWAYQAPAGSYIAQVNYGEAVSSGDMVEGLWAPYMTADSPARSTAYGSDWEQGYVNEYGDPSNPTGWTQTSSPTVLFSGTSDNYQTHCFDQTCTPTPGQAAQDGLLQNEALFMMVAQPGAQEFQALYGVNVWLYDDTNPTVSAGQTAAGAPPAGFPTGWVNHASGTVQITQTAGGLGNYYNGFQTPAIAGQGNSQGGSANLQTSYAQSTTPGSTGICTGDPFNSACPGEVEDPGVDAASDPPAPDTWTLQYPWNTDTMPEGIDYILDAGLDASGNISLSDVDHGSVQVYWPVMVDRTAPPAPQTSGLDGATFPANDPQPVAITASDTQLAGVNQISGPAAVHVSLDGGWGHKITCTSTCSWTPPAGLPEGSHTVTITTTDAAGNTGPAATDTFTVTPAQITLSSLPSSTDAVTLPISGTVNDPAAIANVSITALAAGSSTPVPVCVTTPDASGGFSCAWNLFEVPAGSYTLTAAAADTAGDPAGTTATTIAIATADPPANTTLPQISGTVQVGKTLTAAPGAWTGTTPIAYTYQWEDCTPAGGACTTIPSATSPTYTIGTSDANDTIRAAVTADNSTLNGGTAVTAQSPATSVVDTTAPTITVTGALFDASGGPAISGQQSLTVTAPDAQSGTVKIATTIDGKDQTAIDQTEACPQGACTLTATGQVNTSTFAPGNHTVTVTATDAQGNQTTRTWTITVAAPGPCTDTWTGGAGTTAWGTAANWSADAVPGSSDDACIPAGASVVVSYAPVGRLDSQGTITVDGELDIGTLDAPTPSVTANLIFPSGTLSGAGELDITGHMDWSGGTMTGTGSTVIEPGATASIDPANSQYFEDSNVVLNQRTLENDGTTTFASGTFEGQDAATFLNDGTLKLNSEEQGGLGGVSGSWPAMLDITDDFREYGNTTPSPKLVNAAGATIEKTAGTGTTGDDWPIDNEGTITAQTGVLTPGSNAVTGAVMNGTWTSSGSGSLLLAGTVSLGPNGNIQGQTTIQGNWTAASLNDPGTLTVAGALEISGGSASQINELDINPGTVTIDASGSAATQVASLKMENKDASFFSGGTLQGAGELDVTGSMDWAGGWMRGTGSTVIEQGATASIDPPNQSTYPGDDYNQYESWVGIDQRTLLNKGVTTYASGTLEGDHGATITNDGILKLNSEFASPIPTYGPATASQMFNLPAFYGPYNDTGPEPQLINNADGTIEKTAGTGTTENDWQIDNEGTITAQTGTLYLAGNAVTGAAMNGLWTSSAAGALQLGGTVSLGDDGNIDGDTAITGNWTAQSIDDSGTLTLNGSLEIQSESVASQIQTLDIQKGTATFDSPSLVATQISHLQMDNVDTTSFSGGNLQGPGEVDVLDDFHWDGGTLGGTGRTVIAPGATATIAPPEQSSYPSPSQDNWRSFVRLDQRTLVNQGTTNFNSGTLAGDDGGTIDNLGTLHLNSETQSPLPYYPLYTVPSIWNESGYDDNGIAPVLINELNGLIGKTAGTGELSETWPIADDGEISALSGTLNLDGSTATPDPTASGLTDTVIEHDPFLCDSLETAQPAGFATQGSGIITLSAGCWDLADGAPVSGSVTVAGATVFAGALNAPQGAIQVQSGTLSMDNPATPAIAQDLTMVGGTIAGTGELDITQSMNWQAGSMTDAGATVLESTAQGTINPAASQPVTLAERTLVNNGTLTWTGGNITQTGGSVIDNTGAFNLDAANGTITAASGAGALLNSGTLNVTAVGTGTIAIDPDFIEEGTIAATDIGPNLRFEGDNEDEDGDDPDEDVGVVIEAGEQISLAKQEEEQEDDEAEEREEPASCEKTVGTLHAFRLHTTSNGSTGPIVYRGLIQVDCGEGAEAEGADGHITDLDNGQTVPGPAGMCELSEVCDMVLVGDSDPGSGTWVASNVKQSYQGSGLFEYEDADGEAGGEMLTNIVTIDAPVKVPDYHDPQTGDPQTWTTYEQKLQSLNIVHINREVLSDASANPADPPGTVEAVEPPVGTEIDPASDTVTVTTNPDNMRIPRLAKILKDKNNTANLSTTDAVTIAEQCLNLEDDANPNNPDKTGASTDISFTHCSTVPIFVSGTDVLEATEHDLNAIHTNAEWDELNYEDPKTKPGRGWYADDPDCEDASLVNKEDCDEFPPFSTEQGGPRATFPPSLDVIARFDNRSQGSRLGQFYRKCAMRTGTPDPNGQTNSIGGDAFLFIPMPEGSVQTVGLCNGKTAATNPNSQPW